MLGASPNAFAASSPNLSSPFAIGFLHVRQLARPDFASSITFAMGESYQVGGTVRPMAAADQPYPVIASKIDARVGDYQANHASNSAAVAKLQQALVEATLGGGEKYTSRHKAAGKLL